MCQAGEEKKEKEKSEEEKNESVSRERKRKKEVPAEVERKAGGGERHGCRWTVWTSKRQRPDKVIVGQQRDSPFAAPSRREAHM